MLTNEGSQFNHGSEQALPEPTAARFVGHSRKLMQKLVCNQNDRHDALVYAIRDFSLNHLLQV